MSQNPLAYTGINPYVNPSFLTWQRVPTTSDIYPAGTRVINEATSARLIYQTSGSGIWHLMATGSSELDTLSGDSGIAVPDALSDIEIAGGTNITTSASGSTVTVSLSGTVAVANGGTSSTSFNTNGVVISNTTSTGALSALSLTNGQVVIGSSVGPPTATTLTAGANISIVNGANSITISSSGGGGGGLTWEDIAVSDAAVADTGYMSTAAITMTLPGSPANGDQIGFIASTADALIIQANTGQVIQVGSAASTSAGTVTNTAIGDSLNLIYQSSTLKWFSFATNGNWNTA